MAAAAWSYCQVGFSTLCSCCQLLGRHSERSQGCLAASPPGQEWGMLAGDPGSGSVTDEAQGCVPALPNADHTQMAAITAARGHF